MKRWAVFASGTGTNFANFLRLESEKLKESKIVAVHCNRECPAADKARSAHKELLLLSTKTPQYEEMLIQFLESCRVDQIFLLGYMRILRPRFFELWRKPIYNLHPSLLPKYKGLNAIEQAFKDGFHEYGVSIHEVIPDLDAGRICYQAKLHYQGDCLSELESLVHQLEYESVEKFLLAFERAEKS